MDSPLLGLLLAGIDHALPAASELRRRIHANPRLGGEEEPTASAIREALPWLSLEPVAGTGMIGRIGPPGPSVAIRAELDALPIRELTNAPFASQTRGVMHACGHDVHMAALVALLSAVHSAQLPVGLTALFQPREESSPPGAEDVAASRVLHRYEVAAMVGAHVQPRVPTGSVSTGAGAVNAAFDAFEIKVRGVRGHGGYPHLALDPIGILASIISGLQELGSRAIDPTHPSVISVGQIEGGTAANVIASSATCRGTIRTTSTTDREIMHAAITRMAKGMAAARGTTARVRITPGGPALINSAKLVQAVDPLLKRARLTPLAEPFRSCGSDDFAVYGLEMPILMMFVGAGDHSLHSGHYLPDADAVRRTAHALAAGYVGAAATVRGASDSKPLAVAGDIDPLGHQHSDEVSGQDGQQPRGERQWQRVGA